MNPVPCSHCGYNYMRHTTDPEAPRLCNSCDVREQKRNPPRDTKMQNIDILIKVPQEEYVKIEEYCINNGIDSTKYFLQLHYAEVSKFLDTEEHKEKGEGWKTETEEEENELPSTSTTGMPDKFFKGKKKESKK